VHSSYVVYTCQCWHIVVKQWHSGSVWWI